MTAGSDHIGASWAAPAGIVAGTTLRSGGVSEGAYRSLNLGAHVGDDSAAVAENRRRFADQCGLSGPALWLDPVHGTDVAIDPPAQTVPTADAALSRQPNVACVVLTADCLPVLFTTRTGDAVAAAHAGWRGLQAGILEATVSAFATDPDQLLAWLGPAISAHAFEVGGEVRQAFIDVDADAGRHFTENARGRWQGNLYGLARQRLRAAGVQQISGGGFCTAGEPERWFSYRRDGQCGRMASYIFRRA